MSRGAAPVLFMRQVDLSLLRRMLTLSSKTVTRRCARMAPPASPPAMNTAANPPVDPTTAPAVAAKPWAADTHLPTALLLNLGHAFDHMFLLIFATAVATIAADFGLARW